MQLPSAVPGRPRGPGGDRHGVRPLHPLPGRAQRVVAGRGGGRRDRGGAGADGGVGRGVGAVRALRHDPRHGQGGRRAAAGGG